jgi:hypothetical protein
VERTLLPAAFGLPDAGIRNEIKIKSKGSGQECPLHMGVVVCPRAWLSAIVLWMFADFTATDRWTKKQVHCVYQAMIVAIATRHADAVDIKFLVDGRKVWVALPHPAWVEYKKRTGRAITDSLAVQIAGHYLKTALEAGEGLGREMYSLTIEETLVHLEAAVAEMQAQPA